MKKRLLPLIFIALACGLCACGNKGRLKSPSQIEEIEAKKQRKQAKEAQDNPVAPAPESSTDAPAPDASALGEAK